MVKINSVKRREIKDNKILPSSNKKDNKEV